MNTILSSIQDNKSHKLLAREKNKHFFAGISLVDGPLWKIHRKFTMLHLRNAGFGKGPMERDVQASSQELVEWITTQGRQPLWPKDILPLVVLNVLWKCAASRWKTVPNTY